MHPPTPALAPSLRDTPASSISVGSVELQLVPRSVGGAPFAGMASCFAASRKDEMRASGGKGRGGTPDYTDDEVMALLDILERDEPLGEKMCAAVSSQ